MMMTKKQKQLFDFIDRFIQEYGYAPSYREVMSSLGYKSVSTVASHVDNLIIQGYLEKKDKSARSIRVVGKPVVSQKSAAVTAAQEKWLIEKIEQSFQDVEEQTDRTKESVEQLYILAGALHLLGFTEAALAFKVRIRHLETP
jgi:SOS-response transcriptional repressor LexA